MKDKIPEDKKDLFTRKLDDFVAIVTFLTAASIKKRYKTLDAYRKALADDIGHVALNLHLDRKKIIKPLTRFNHDCFLGGFLKRCTREEEFEYHRAVAKTWKDGRKFERKSWFEIPLEKLEKYFAEVDGKQPNLNTKTCEFLSREQHRWIDKHVFTKSEMKKEDTMTEKRKREIKEECEAGKHATSPDYIIKQEAKLERSQKKREKNAERKQELKEIEKQTPEDDIPDDKVEDKLKVPENDIPDLAAEDKQPTKHLLSLEEFNAAYPDGVDPESFDFSTLSEECLAALQAERAEEESWQHRVDTGFAWTDIDEETVAKHAEALSRERREFCAENGIDPDDKKTAVKIPMWTNCSSEEEDTDKAAISPIQRVIRSLKKMRGEATEDDKPAAAEQDNEAADPNADIPDEFEEEIPGMREFTCENVQRFIDKHIISLKDGRAIAHIMHNDSWTLREAKSGTTYIELDRNYEQRWRVYAKVARILSREVNKMLAAEDKLAKHFARTFRDLEKRRANGGKFKAAWED